DDGRLVDEHRDREAAGSPFGAGQGAAGPGGGLAADGAGDIEPGVGAVEDEVTRSADSEGGGGAVPGLLKADRPVFVAGGDRRDAGGTQRGVDRVDRRGQVGSGADGHLGGVVARGDLEREVGGGW